MLMSFDGRTASMARRRWALSIRRVRMAGFNHGLRGGQDLGRSGHGKTFNMKNIVCFGELAILGSLICFLCYQEQVWDDGTGYTDFET